MLILAMGSLIVFLVMVHLIIGRTCRENRGILVQAPIEEAWRSIRDFGALHAEHGRGRPLVAITSSSLVRGDGLEPGSIWKQTGTWDGAPYWAEIEVIESEAPSRIVVSLRRDSFATQSGLMRHRLTIDLARFDAHRTQVRLRMTARLNNMRLVLARTLSPERMHARLLDLGLRSVQRSVEVAGLRAAASHAATMPGLMAASFAGAPLETADARPHPGMLPEWIKPEVAAAALYGLRPGSADAWAVSTEGTLDRS